MNKLSIVKLMGVIFLMCGMITFSSCEDDDPVTDDPSKEEPTPEPGH